jgi:hypothetical protein
MRIPVVLDERDFEALKVLAHSEYRDGRGQAAILIREGLQNRGLLNGQHQSGDQIPNSHSRNTNICELQTN